MKAKLPKVRKFWRINPRARIKQSRNVYSRRKAEEEKRKLEREEGRG
jgi:hypothetical protein